MGLLDRFDLKPRHPLVLESELVHLLNRDDVLVIVIGLGLDSATHGRF